MTEKQPEVALLQAEVVHLKERLEDRDKHNRELVTSTWSADQQSQQQTIDSIKKRVDDLATEFGKDVTILREKLDTSMKGVEKQITDFGKTNWPLIVASLSVVMGILAGGWVIMGLFVQSATAPQTVALGQLLSTTSNLDNRLHLVENSTFASNAADSAGRSDREQLNGRLRTLEATVHEDSAQRRSEGAAITQKLTEVETQFCASDIVRNLITAADLRLFSMLWSNDFPGQHMPTDNAYYPRVCNRVASEAR
jgi:DNA anti-recombination protein RmuC